jgi:hypothetical protein
VSEIKALKASGSFISTAVYARPSLRLDGGIGGRSGQRPKAPWVLRQSARCSGVLSRPHEQVKFALSCLNFRWYQAKSPCADRMERSLARVGLGRSSSAGPLRGVQARSQLLYHLESFFLMLDHQLCCLSCSSCRAIDLMPDSVGVAALPVGCDGWQASRLASLSAASFPSISMCPGAHLIETSWVSMAPWHSRKAH